VLIKKPGYVRVISGIRSYAPGAAIYNLYNLLRYHERSIVLGKHNKTLGYLQSLELQQKGLGISFLPIRKRPALSSFIVSLLRLLFPLLCDIPVVDPRYRYFQRLPI